MKTSSPSARRPSAGVMPGRRGACLAVRTSPAVLFCGSEIRHHCGRSRCGIRSPLEIRDDFATGACHESGKNADVETLTEEMDAAVGEYDGRAARVEAVQFPVVGAIHG